MCEYSTFLPDAREMNGELDCQHYFARLLTSQGSTKSNHVQNGSSTQSSFVFAF